MMNRRYVRSLSALVMALLLLLSTSVDAISLAASYDPNELSYGLYWFGKDSANQKFVAGEANPYFDPAKPTLIFAHGWQPFISDKLPTFDFDGTDTAAGWIDAGWNVGIFVWNQFSDETTGVTLGAWFGEGPPPQGVLDAEAKIWTPNGPRGMRWRDWDKLLTMPPDYGYSDPPSGTPGAGELFYETYTAALPETYTQTIRIAGHSLGNQMAVRLTHLVDEGITAGDVSENLRPTRVALLDPYWSPDARADIPDGDAAGRKTGDVVREYIAALIPAGTLFEWYWSSEWTTAPQGDANDALKPQVFYAEMDPAFETDDLDKHLAAQHLYFWSHAFDGPAACTGDACLDMTRVLSKMSDQQLAAVMDADCYWIQDGGQSTKTPQDDTYHSVCASECIPLTSAAIEGPLDVTGTLYTDAPYTFEAAITPITATTPITYTWTPTPTNGQHHPTARYQWDTPGAYTITLTAENCGGPITAPVREVIVEAPPYRIYLPLILRHH